MSNAREGVFRAHVARLRWVPLLFSSRGGAHRWRRAVIGAAPGHHLINAVLLSELALVVASKRSRVLLVKARVLNDRQPALVCAREHEARGADGSAQARGAHEVMLLVIAGEQTAGLPCLGDAALGQVDVDPTGETVGQIPLRLSVPQQCEACMWLTAV